MSSGNLEGEIATAFKRSWQKLLLARSAKRPEKAMIFSKTKTINKLHRQLRLRSILYPFLFENNLVCSLGYILEPTRFSQTLMTGILSLVPLAIRCRSLVVEP